MKKYVVPAYTTSAVLDYEAHIDYNIEKLINLLRDAGSEVNLASWINFFTFDTISRIAFSDDQGLMDKQTDLGNVLEASNARSQHWHDWSPLPKLERLIFKNRLAIRATGTSRLGQLAGARLQDRTEKGGLGTHQDLLDRYLQAGAHAPQLFDQTTIFGLVISTIHAGSETTSTTLNVLLHRLLSTPHTLSKLRAELKSANLPSPPPWSSVSHLPYLDAVFKESMRMDAFVLDPLERLVPHPGMRIADTWIPAGTTVAMNTHALNRDTSIYGPDVDVYRPERWLEADAAQLARMDHANLYFSAGRRACIGKHVAWVEMKKFLPELLMQFDVSTVLL
jgi:cytochrome P450